MLFRVWLLLLIFQSVYSCSGGGSESTTTLMPPAGEGKKQGNKDTKDKKDEGQGKGDDELPDMNAFGKYPGMTFFMTTSGNMKGIYTNSEGAKYKCREPETPVIKWSSFGPMGSGVFHDKKIIMCGVSTDQKTETSKMGCAYLHKDGKTIKWKPLEAKLPNEMQKRDISLIFVTTNKGIFGAINKGNTISKTFLLPNVKSKNWEAGPNFPENKVVSEYCFLSIGSSKFHILIGGRVKGKAQKKVYIINWANQKWMMDYKSMPVARYDMACGFRRAKKDGKYIAAILVTGGLDDSGEVLRSTYQLLVNDKKWVRLPDFSFFRDGSGVVGGMFTIYYDEPLLVGGHVYVKSKANNKLVPNKDYFHFYSTGDSDDTAFWTRIFRPNFPSLDDVFSNNTVLFDVSPTNYPTCEKRKKTFRRTLVDRSLDISDGGMSRRARRRNDCCEYVEPGQCHQECTRDRLWYNLCGPGCHIDDCFCKHCRDDCRRYRCYACPIPPPVPPPIPAIPVAPPIPPPVPPNDDVTLYIEIKACNGGHHLRGVRVTCTAGCLGSTTQYSSSDGYVKFTVPQLAQVHVCAFHQDFKTKSQHWQVESCSCKGIENRMLCLFEKDPPYCHCDGRRNSKKKLVTQIVLNWSHIPRDLNLQVTEYRDKDFKIQTCQVNADNQTKTLEQTCQRGSKSVKMVTSNYSYGWDPEVIGFTEKSDYFYAVEVHDNTPTFNKKVGIKNRVFNFFHSRADVGVISDGSETKTFKLENIENLFELEVKLSHWFVGCFHGRKPSNFYAVNQGFGLKPSDKPFLSQKIHQQYCAGKVK